MSGAFPPGKRSRINPQLNPAAEMCDRKSVEIVTREWKSKVSRGLGRCSYAGSAWRTSIGGVSRVRDVIGKWSARDGLMVKTRISISTHSRSAGGRGKRF